MNLLWQASSIPPMSPFATLLGGLPQCIQHLWRSQVYPPHTLPRGGSAIFATGTSWLYSRWSRPPEG
jgi:hypothetical protein